MEKGRIMTPIPEQVKEAIEVTREIMNEWLYPAEAIFYVKKEALQTLITFAEKAQEELVKKDKEIIELVKNYTSAINILNEQSKRNASVKEAIMNVLLGK